MSDVVIEGLHKQYGAVAAIDRVSLTIPSGQLVSLLGPSGCGKTTTLNCIAGLETPDAGSIRAGDLVLTDIARRVALPPERRGLGMVFQSYALWPHMTVHENLAFGLRLRKVPRAEITGRIDSALDLVGLGGLGARYPFQLSGGQQQRVALARAVVVEPRVLLLDEPLSNLDAKVRESARAWLRELQQRLGITTIYVTHDQAEALAMSDKIAIMSQGRLAQYGPPEEIYRRPASHFVADFIGASSFLTGEIEGTVDGAAQIRLDGGNLIATARDQELPPTKRVVLAIRAERLRIVTANENAANLLPGTIRTGLYQGATYQYVIDTPEGAVRVDTPQELDWQHGPTNVLLSLPPDAIVVLPEEPEYQPQREAAPAAVE